jgi:type IV secretion system protein VirD4
VKGLQRLGTTLLGLALLSISIVHGVIAVLVSCDPLDRFERLFPQVSNATGGELVLASASTILGLLGLAFVLRPASAVRKRRPDLLRRRRTGRDVGRLLRRREGSVWCGQANGRHLFASAEDRAVVIGPPGTGKTAFLVSQLLTWAEQRRSFVCLDLKPEIYGLTSHRLEAAGYTLLTYNPTSRTGQRYNPLDDAAGPEGLGELAAALIGPGDEAHRALAQIARELLDAIAGHLRATLGMATLPLVREFLAAADSPDDLFRQLLASPDGDVRDIAASLQLAGRNERLLGSVFANFRASLRFLRFPAIRDSLECSDFSLRDLCTDQPVGLFLQFEEQHRETTAHLLAAMVSHVMRYLIAHHERPPVLLLWDEIGTAPALPALVQKLNTIRSRNLPTWLYWQSLEQMQPYGAQRDEGPNLILGACDLQMVFRLNDNASAQWMSERLGVVDRLVERRGVTSGGRSAVTDSPDLVQEPVIFPHELAQLASGEMVCTYRGRSWRGRGVPYFERWPALAGRNGTLAHAERLGAPYPAACSSALPDPVAVLAAGVDP